MTTTKATFVLQKCLRVTSELKKNGMHLFVSCRSKFASIIYKIYKTKTLLRIYTLQTLCVYISYINFEVLMLRKYLFSFCVLHFSY